MSGFQAAASAKQPVAPSVSKPKISPAPGEPDPGPPGVVASDPVPENGHQELAVVVADPAPPRGTKRFPDHAVRRRDPLRDPPGGLRREQAARAQVLDDRECGACE
ncbi:hypothetical protein [Streptomyces canus]|uniref:hypothetical protein n=1 Tax=Streptomyces canus TaxID=58343 RepID=UPI002E2D56AA|nr:hypothetical protein [Streptomyces canus]